MGASPGGHIWRAELSRVLWVQSWAVCMGSTFPSYPIQSSVSVLDLSLPMSFIGILSGASAHTYDVSYSKELQVTLEVFKMRLDREGAR